MKKITLSALTLAAVLSAGFISCSKKEAAPAAATPAEAPAKAVEEKAAPAAEEKVSQYVHKTSGIYISANDIEVGKIMTDQKVEDGFVIHGAQKPIEVAKTDIKIAGEKFTQRFKMSGSAVEKGGEPVSVISFPAKKGETITLYGISSSKTEARVAEIYDESKAVVASIPLPVYSGDDDAPAVGTYEVTADGTYSIGSKSSTIYIYYINVSK